MKADLCTLTELLFLIIVFVMTITALVVLLWWGFGAYHFVTKFW